LVEGKMTPLNPLDDKLQHIYIHNSIFYSIAQETPYNYSQEKGIDATPTVSAVNADLRNTSRILELGIPDLNILHMALIEYRGFRVIAQCIIPGILTAEQLQCSQYGSIDDGKTIADNK
jgi:protein TIF31